MSEFNNRISAQRKIINIINNAHKWHEELFGLSNGAIERWINTNNIPPNSILVRLIYQAAEKLFFLSNKSQEQVTDEYKDLSKEVSIITDQIKQEIMKN